MDNSPPAAWIRQTSRRNTPPVACQNPPPFPARGSPSQVACPECGGPMIAARLRFGTGDIVVERLGVWIRELLVRQAAKAKGRSPLEARVCTECGFTKIYAARLSQLME